MKNRHTKISAWNRFVLVEIIFFLFLIMGFSSYITSRTLLQNKMSTAAGIIGGSLPYFFENGQALIYGMASEITDTENLEEIAEIIDQKMQDVPFFSQVVLMDDSGNLVGGYPEDGAQLGLIYESEALGLGLAKQGVPTQVITIPPVEKGGPVQLSFLAALKNDEGGYAGVLSGRTDLISNPFFKPALQAIQSIEQSGGTGIILDEEKRIVYHKDTARLLEEFSTILPEEKQFFRGDSQSYLYYYPVAEEAWSILISVPFSLLIKSAIINAVPVTGSILIFSLILFFVFKSSLADEGTKAIDSYKEAALSPNTNKVTEGNGFRKSLLGKKLSLDDNQLLAPEANTEALFNLSEITREIAFNPDPENIFQKILEYAMDTKKSMAKIIIVEEIPAKQPGLQTYTLGANRKDFNYLDKPLLALMREQDQLVIQDYKNNPVIELAEGKRIPGALYAFALRQLNKYSGVFYVTFHDPCPTSDGETNYLKALANLAVMAIDKGNKGIRSDRSLEKLVAMLDSTPEPILLVDDKLHLIYSNPAAAHLPSLLKEELPGKFINEVIQNQRLLDLFGKPIDGIKIEDEITLKTGSTYWAKLFPVPFEDGSTGRMAVLQDESHYKEMDALKTEYISTVSHDLRSPLSLMKGYASMLPMVGELNEQQKIYTQKIVSITDHLTNLVSDLLDLGRIENGTGLGVEKIQVHEIVKRVLNILQPQINQKKIVFGMDMPDMSETVVEGDPALIQQALFNLLENAIKFTQLSGKIQLRVRMNKPNIIFEIVDTGIGIAPLDLPNIFEKFYKVSGKNVQQYQGTGLGLAIVKSIAQRHHGRVWAVSQLGKGSVFYLEIPTRQK